MNKILSDNANLLIIGGYGQVGRVISTMLSEKFPGRVIAAGRNYDEAERFSATTGGNVLPVVLNIHAPSETAELLRDVRLVVMCVEKPDIRFVANCLQRGIHYVDVSASYEWLSQLESIDDEAKQGNATAVLSVGLAPGLTNLLAAYNQRLFDEVKQLDIFVMLGLGEVHGEAAVRWTVENANSEFTVHADGKVKRVRSFQDSKTTVFPDGLGRRRTFRFNFSDQHILVKTLDIGSASTWLCFDSALATSGFALGQKTGLFKLLRFKAAREFLVRLFRAVHFGSDQFAIRVDMRGVVDGQLINHASAITGRNEGYTTGIVAAEVAERLYTSSYPAGVFHIEQIVEPADFIAQLEPHRLRFIPSIAM
jgi:saccharopine dehydrogenase-like NADP-dependent oxidoreductase